MKVYDLTYEQLRNFNKCPFKRLTILLLILMNICIYIVYEIENTIVSMTKLYSSILPSTYLFSDFAQPIHFAKQERVYGIFYAYVFTKKSTSSCLQEAHVLYMYIYSRFVVGSIPCSSSCVLCIQFCQFLLIVHSVKIKFLTD